MKQNSIAKMIRCLLVFLTCLLGGAGAVFALDLPMNVTEISSGGRAHTKFKIYADGSGDTHVYLKLDLDQPSELWTDMQKGNLMGGSIWLDVLMADKKTVIFSRNVVFNTGHSNPIAFRGTLPGGTYYFHFHH